MESYFTNLGPMPEIAGDDPVLFTTIWGKSVVWGHYHLTRNLCPDLELLYICPKNWCATDSETILCFLHQLPNMRTTKTHDLNTHTHTCIVIFFGPSWVDFFSASGSVSSFEPQNVAKRLRQRIGMWRQNDRMGYTTQKFNSKSPWKMMF